MAASLLVLRVQQHHSDARLKQPGLDEQEREQALLLARRTSLARAPFGLAASSWCLCANSFFLCTAFWCRR